MSARGKSAQGRAEQGPTGTARKASQAAGRKAGRKVTRKQTQKTDRASDGLVRTKDDVQALRLASLVVGFSNASVPISSRDIHEAWYRGSSDETFIKSFRRDRERLEQCGFILCSAGRKGEFQLWKIDEQASLAEDGVISDSEAMLLETILSPLTCDPSFALRDELVIALAKVNRSYEMRTAPRAGDGATNARLDTLVRALEAHKLVSAKYRRADGEVVARTLAPLGTFGLRSSTYFVADSFDEAAGNLENHIRTYRLDRFTSARLVAPGSSAPAYVVPADFDVEDYRHLPFQIGDPLGEASFAVPAEPASEVVRAMDSHGRLSEDGLTWHVPFFDVRAAARWALDNGLVPLGPAEVTGAWREALVAARSCLAEDMSPEAADVLANRVGYKAGNGRSAPRGTGSARRVGGAGRRGGLVTARRLVTLIGSLQREGDTISAEVAAARLSCSLEEAHELLALIADASDFDGMRRLPLLTDESHSEASLAYPTAKGRPVRLTKRETRALLLALGEIGMSVDSPLVTKLIRSLASSAFDQAEVGALLGRSSGTQPPGFREALAICSKAIAESQDLVFSYTDGAGRTRDRRLDPEQLFREESHWYVRGFDLARRDGRTFRLDRMAGVRACTPEPNPTWAMPLAGIPKMPASEADAAANESVPIAFFEITDESLLDLFSWPHAKVVRSGGRAFAVADDYKTTWLPRRLAACAGGVRIFDEDLAARVRAWAQGVRE